MTKKQFFAPLFFIILFGISFSIPGYSFTDQSTSERIIKENKEFVEFINVALTNFGENRTEEFRKSYEKHFNAEVAYLQSDYKRAFRRIYESQTGLDRLYEDVVKKIYLEDAKDFLDKLAPNIIRSKNQKARLYLTLGYRDRSVSWTHFTIGEASNPKMHSYKIFQYVEAIKMARRAKRYGFLALFESRDIETKKRIYNNLMKTEMAQGNLFYNRFLDKKDNAFLDEIAKTYEDYEKDQEKSESKKDEKPAEKQKLDKFEKKVEKRVRFRYESRVARFVLNGEFEKADDILRTYIEDFNFKLINSTLDMLSESGQAVEPKKEDKKIEDKKIDDKPAEVKKDEKTGDDKIDYKSMKVHLLDNYLRLSKDKSVLDRIIKDIKVEDDVQLKQEEKQKTDAAEKDKSKADDAAKDQKKELKDARDSKNEPEKKETEKDIKKVTDEKK